MDVPNECCDQTPFGMGWGGSNFVKGEYCEMNNVGMSDRAYIVSRTLENKIAIAENNDQNTLIVTLDVLKEILALLKEQEKENSRIANEYLNLVKVASKQPQIVRCKDCRNAVVYDDNEVVCDHIDSNGNDKHPADWFCADGVKK